MILACDGGREDELDMFDVGLSYYLSPPLTPPHAQGLPGSTRSSECSI